MAKNCADELMVVRWLAVQEAKRAIRELIENGVSILHLLGGTTIDIGKLDASMLARFPVGYRHLGYLQAKNGFDVRPGLPGLVGEAVDRLYEEGRAWLAGSERPGVPL